MTQPLELPLLNIDSQAQLISRLQFLSRFASNFIHVSGDHGAGKTQIAHQYLEYSDSTQNCALVSCRPNQQDSMVRTMILQQLFREPLFDANDKLLDSFERMQGNERCDLVIVIDDAHCLSFDLFSELWTLTQETAIRPTWKINVILFAQKELLKRYVSQVEQISGDSKIVEIDIAPLTINESEQFLGSMQAIGALSIESVQRFQEQMTSKDFVPGEILSMAEQFESGSDASAIIADDAPVKSKRAKRAKKPKKKSRFGAFFTLLLLLLIAGIGSAFWWMPEDMQNQASQMLHQYFDESDEEQVANSGADLLATKDGVKLTDLMQERKEITAAELPKPIMSDGVTLESPAKNENEQRVVVSSEVVDTLIEKEDEALKQQQGATLISEGETEQTKEQTQAPQQGASLSVEQQLAQVVSARQEQAQQQTQQVQQQAQEESATSMDLHASNQDVLLARDSRHFTLQFAAAKDLTAAMEFIETTKIEPKDMLVYRAKHQDDLWYIFVAGDYPNMEQARRAIVTLPQALQDVKPWVKSYRKVKEEINQAK